MLLVANPLRPPTRAPRAFVASKTLLPSSSCKKAAQHTHTLTVVTIHSWLQNVVFIFHHSPSQCCPFWMQTHFSWWQRRHTIHQVNASQNVFFFFLSFDLCVSKAFETLPDSVMLLTRFKDPVTIIAVSFFFISLLFQIRIVWGSETDTWGRMYSFVSWHFGNVDLCQTRRLSYLVKILSGRSCQASLLKALEEGKEEDELF